MQKWNFGCLRPSGERQPSMEDRFKTRGSVTAFTAVRMCSFIGLSKSWHFPRACWLRCDLKSSTQAHGLVSVIQVRSFKSLQSHHRNNTFEYLFSSSLTAACLAENEDRGAGCYCCFWIMKRIHIIWLPSWWIYLYRIFFSVSIEDIQITARLRLKIALLMLFNITVLIFFFLFINHVGVQQNLALGGFCSSTSMKNAKRTRTPNTQCVWASLSSDPDILVVDCGFCFCCF